MKKKSSKKDKERDKSSTKTKKSKKTEESSKVKTSKKEKEKEKDDLDSKKVLNNETIQISNNIIRSAVSPTTIPASKKFESIDSEQEKIKRKGQISGSANMNQSQNIQVKQSKSSLKITDNSNDINQLENLKLKIKDLEGKITEINKGILFKTNL